MNCVAKKRQESQVSTDSVFWSKPCCRYKVCLKAVSPTDCSATTSFQHLTITARNRKWLCCPCHYLLSRKVNQIIQSLVNMYLFRFCSTLCCTLCSILISASARQALEMRTVCIYWYFMHSIFINNFVLTGYSHTPPCLFGTNTRSNKMTVTDEWWRLGGISDQLSVQ